jgi:predicted nucleic-acid-binding protein
MIVADANVWARAILGDDPKQSRLARKQLEAARDAEGIHIPLIVLAELAWVLGSAEGWDSARVIQALERLLSMRKVEVESHTIALDALVSARKGGAGVADYLILGLTQAQGFRTVLTFDRKLARDPRATLLKT